MGKKTKSKSGFPNGKRAIHRRLLHIPKVLFYRAKLWWDDRLWHKAVAVFFLLVMLWVGGMYGVARWYMWERRSQPLK